MIKPKNYLLLSLIIIININTMELPSQMAKTSWTSGLTKGLAIIGGILLGTIAIKMLLQQPEQTFELFEELPPEMQYYVINLITIETQADNLKEATYAINALSQVNKELNFLINDPKYFFKLIKSLALRFNTTEENVCEKLQTMAAKEYLSVNEKDPTLRDGNTPLMKAIWRGNEQKISELLHNKYLSINIQNNLGKTALIAALEKLVLIYSLPVGIEKEEEEKKVISYIYALLVYHADPELADFSGITPMHIAQQIGNEQVIHMIHNYINKKHGKSHRYVIFQ